LNPYIVLSCFFFSTPIAFKRFICRTGYVQAMGKIGKILRLMMPLSKEKERQVLKVSMFLPKEDVKEIVKLIKEKDAELHTEKAFDAEIIRIRTSSGNVKLQNYIRKIDGMLKDKQSIDIFSQIAKKDLVSLIAPNIYGMDSVKKAALLQVFSDKVHTLLLGDPGTGKTEILRSATTLSPISSFGLGSGTTGAGLSVTVSGKEVMPGLLPMADGGICAIDELNLMEDKDRASLYNAMEKGFVTYDKGGKHYRFPANIRVLATANPKGDKFTGKTVAQLKKQLPFDPALLSRFHLVFLIRKPSAEEFRRIASDIVAGKSRSEMDTGIIKDFVTHARSIDVKVPKELEDDITDFVAGLREDEDKYLIEITPRLVKGFISLAKASARMRLAHSVEERDIKLVKDLITQSLAI
jgi:DNA replicative helicase MCM subunit Mcm2 (Cdc46/Mcm family)